MSRITGFGDAAVTIAAAFLLLLFFLRSSRPVALRWLKAVIACGLLTAAGKVALYTFGIVPHGVVEPTYWLLSPSGHVAGSVLVYGVLPLGTDWRGRGLHATVQPALPAIGAAVALIALIAASRIYLQFHTSADVIAGGCIGGACLAWFAIAEGRQARPALRVGLPVTLFVCALGVALGWRLNLDHSLHWAAGLLRGLGVVTGWEI